MLETTMYNTQIGNVVGQVAVGIPYTVRGLRQDSEVAAGVWGHSQEENAIGVVSCSPLCARKRSSLWSCPSFSRVSALPHPLLGIYAQQWVWESRELYVLCITTSI